MVLKGIIKKARSGVHSLRSASSCDLLPCHKNRLTSGVTHSLGGWTALPPGLRHSEGYRRESNRHHLRLKCPHPLSPSQTTHQSIWYLLQTLIKIYSNICRVIRRRMEYYPYTSGIGKPRRMENKSMGATSLAMTKHLRNVAGYGIRATILEAIVPLVMRKVNGLNPRSASFLMSAMSLVLQRTNSAASRHSPLTLKTCLRSSRRRASLILNMLGYALGRHIPHRITYMRLTSIVHTRIFKNFITRMRYYRERATQCPSGWGCRWSPSGKRGVGAVRSRDGDGAETELLASRRQASHVQERACQYRWRGGRRGRMHIAQKQPARDLRLVSIMGRRPAIAPDMMMRTHLEIDSLVNPHERKKTTTYAAVEIKEPIARRDMMGSQCRNQLMRTRFLISMVWEPAITTLRVQKMTIEKV